MPDPKAKDTIRDIPHRREPTPNEVAGQYDRVDPEDLTEEQLKNWKPGQLDLESWNPPANPENLDPEVHTTVVPRAERDGDAQLASRPVASGDYAS